MKPRYVVLSSVLTVTVPRACALRASSSCGDGAFELATPLDAALASPVERPSAASTTTRALKALGAFTPYHLLIVRRGFRGTHAAAQPETTRIPSFAGSASDGRQTNRFCLFSPLP
jgi:hypothetical protein